MIPARTDRFGRVVRLLMIVAALSVTSCASRVSYRELAQEYYNLGNAFFELGDFETSFLYYTRATELDSSLPATGYNLARLHVQRGEFDEALGVMDQLLDNDPENGLYLETLAYVHYGADNLAQARDGYQQLIERFPGRSRLRYNLALLELEQGQPGTARTVLLQGLEAASDDREYHWLIAEAAYEDDDPDDAAAYLDRYRTLVNEDPALLGRLARRYAQWDFALAALDVLSQIPQTVRDDPDLLFLEGRLLLVRTPDFDDGLQRLRDAFDAGFEDEDELGELLETVRPGDRDTVEALYEEFGLDGDSRNDTASDEDTPET